MNKSIKLLLKEFRLCMHPFAYVAVLLSALVFVPGYPYGVCCFYVMLAVYFISLSARENHDAGFTLTLPVSRKDAVRARIFFCALIELAQIVIMSLFIILKYTAGFMPNPAGLDAGLALTGEGLLLYAIFNIIFFPIYYRDINKPGRAFLFASAAVFIWIVFEIIATYALPFVRDVLDTPDPVHMLPKAVFTLAALAVYLLAAFLASQFSSKTFQNVDLSL